MKMTLKEAKAYIEDLLHMAQAYTFIFSKETVKSLEIALDAIDKRLAIPPKRDTITNQYYCTTCHAYISRPDEYCWNCGQAIDWHII